MTRHSAQLNFAPVSMVTTSLGKNDPDLGTWLIKDDEEYQFVYNAGNSQIPPSYGCVLSAVTGYSVTISSTSGKKCFGIVKHATLTTGAYGWVLKKGFCQVEMGTNLSMAANGIGVLDADGVFEQKSISTGFPAPACIEACGTAIGSAASGRVYASIY